MRRQNLGAVLTQVHRAGPLSRAELTARLGLNRSTIGALTAELAAAGIVRESAPAAGGAGRAGRPSLVVTPDAARSSVLAAHVGVGRIAVARTGLGGQVLDRVESRLGPDGHGFGTVVDRLVGMATTLVDRAEPGVLFLGMGIGIAGMVRREDGTVRQAPNLDWVDRPLGRMVADRLPLPLRVVVGNDADLGALAEHVRGAAVACDNVVYLAGDTGVGGGVLVDGRMLHGRGGYGGEVGHVMVNPAGRRCRCGSRGCWETEVGEDAVLVEAGRPAGGGREAVLGVLAAAAAGEPAAAAALRRVGRWLGVGVAGLVNTFNPEVVVFGGVLADVFAAVGPRLVEQVEAIALAAPREQARFVRAGLGVDSTLLGAAELAFEPFLADPLGRAAMPAQG
ncbi:MAG TPA: ROK family protein [Mycobacteriales bacterium]